MEIHRSLDRALDLLRDRVLLLGGKTEAALQRAMYALVERDSDAAREVLENDDEIDRLELEIDRLCIDILALKQPAARDLRFVISVAKITPILERIADHACNIARVAIDLNDEPQLKPYVDLPRMADLASQMLRAALDAFTSGDAMAARAVITRDDEIDELYNRIFHDLIELMAQDPTTTGRAARLLFVAKHLERIADYVTDICELTVYMAEAAVIKHSN
ncbi:phosphate signaling complex protein PhoU [Pyrinomonas methylaliphatogenes]|jgi:phosphate transport system protein|uniref:Phosphate-specific transport system accessory protein PhoU n=1 Tax=Pyrinomonas methylaliphatogenes TaxID=454194 RepID=A0A0B6WYZ1_9BACT|nr:phosphate signaling complex protein PhoU [Pyrinomonas methylaliphatogenes]MBX5479613.1 phosphate signaling complex protein PhoU [Pyrinomonas methylaliphatogenes]CDM66321.1 phosphate transport system regulatory protein PhoU [Pyrinomonas methylaliphatogenes]